MMESKSKGSFALFLAALCLSAMPTVASAQTYNYSVYVDSDARPSTGCNEGPVAGSEVRLQVTASSGLAPQVLQVTRARCAGGAFVADGVIGGNYPVGTDNGTAGGDVIELSDSLGQFLIGGGSPSLHFSVVANSATGEDSLLSTDGSVGGPPITLGLPAIPIPVLGIPALILMAILIAIVGARVARRRGLWRVVALVFLTSGIALAANFVVDGQVGDWNGVSPLATDPAGDSTSGESAIDLRAFFAAIENNRVFMRIDVSNLQNNAPIAVAGSATLLEDEAIALNLTGTDNENDTLTFAIVNPPANGSLGAIVPGGPQSATVQYTPNADANGSDSFTFTVDDGQATSAPATISLTITPVNDVPVFTAGANQSVLEDAGTQSVAAWASNLSPGPANESGQALDFIVSNDNNALFSAQPAVSPTGVLTYTPAANANGTANVTVSLHDNGGTADGGVDTVHYETLSVLLLNEVQRQQDEMRQQRADILAQRAQYGIWFTSG
ncbi:MAG TPA: Ig-like domain-containing protein, partial [Dokdonella sp.]|nr:Ig-like domain-containing protein [Dokdonella sp.]